MPRNDVSQWSTLKSGPLAPQKKAEFRAFATKKREPVDHSKEWTTGYPEKGRIPGFCQSSPKSCVKICRLSYSLFAFGEVDKEGACVSLPSIV